MSTMSFSGGGAGTEVVAVSYKWNAANLAVDSSFFVADRSYTIVSCIVRVDTVGSNGSPVTCQIRKAASGTAGTSGTVIHSSTGDLKGTANTNQTLTLSTTPSDLNLPSGSCLYFDLTGTSTAAIGSVTVTLIAG